MPQTPSQLQAVKRDIEVWSKPLHIRSVFGIGEARPGPATPRFSLPERQLGPPGPCRGLAPSPEIFRTFGPQQPSATPPTPGDPLTEWMPVDRTMPTQSSLHHITSVSYSQPQQPIPVRESRAGPIVVLHDNWLSRPWCVEGI